MNAAKSNNWPLLALFTSSLIAPAAYIIAALSGWIEWATWLPLALSSVFLAWASAARINRAAE